MNPTTQDWPIKHQLLDDYEVMRVLGEGGRLRSPALVGMT